MMNIKLLISLAVIFVIITIIVNIVSIVKNLLDSRKYFHASMGIKNNEFPSSYGFTNNDLMVVEQFCGKFRGSVRLGSSNIYTDEQIEEKRKKAKLPLP